MLSCLCGGKLLVVMAIQCRQKSDNGHEVQWSVKRSGIEEGWSYGYQMLIVDVVMADGRWSLPYRGGVAVFRGEWWWWSGCVTSKERQSTGGYGYENVGERGVLVLVDMVCLKVMAVRWWWRPVLPFNCNGPYGRVCHVELEWRLSACRIKNQLNPDYKYNLQSKLFQIISYP